MDPEQTINNNTDEQQFVFKELPKSIRVILAILGGTRTIFNIFLPIAVALMITKFYTLTSISQYIVIIAGSLTTLYEAISTAGIDTIEYLYNKFRRD